VVMLVWWWRCGWGSSAAGVSLPPSPGAKVPELRRLLTHGEALSVCREAAGV
jgi:hypothetical protein